jgi:hypothetical protein
MRRGWAAATADLKQIDPVDEQGQILIDYAIYDARSSGLRKGGPGDNAGNGARFPRGLIGDRIAAFVDLRYAYQRLEALPEGFRVPVGRTKPWGNSPRRVVPRALDRRDRLPSSTRTIFTGALRTFSWRTSCPGRAEQASTR